MYYIEVLTRDEGTGLFRAITAFKAPDLKTVVSILQCADDNCMFDVYREPGGGVSSRSINTAFAKAKMDERVSRHEDDYFLVV